MYGAEVSSEGAFEIERIDAVHPMQLVAPLHGVATHVPKPSTDVSKRFPLAEALVDLGQRSLRQAGFGELLCHGDGSGEGALGIEQRRDRQRNRHLHAVFALNLGDDSIDAFTCRDAHPNSVHIPARFSFSFC